MARVISKIKELFSIDIRSLAIFRIGLGLVLLFDLICRAQDLRAFYTDDGVLPRTVVIDRFLGPWVLSVHMMSGIYEVQAVLFLISVIFAIALVIGYQTRFVAFVSWFLLISLQARNPTLFYLGDQLLRLLLFWSMFLPLGACYSVDGKSNFSKVTFSKLVFSAGSVSLLAQFVFLYVFTALLKTGKEWHEEASAVFYALNVDQYQTPVGIFLLNYPDFLKFLTRLVLDLELYGSFLLFIPIYTAQIRLILILVFFAMQLGFGFCLTLGLFPFISSLAIIPFVPSKFWDEIFPKLSTFLSVPKNFFYESINLLEKYIRILIPFSFNIPSYIPRNVETFLVSFLLAYVFWWNLWSINPKCQIPERLKWIGYLLSIDQRWDMFAPCPYKQGGFYVGLGTLMDETEIDVLRDGKKVNWEKPKLASSLFKSDRWRTYMMKMWDTHNKDQINFFCKYICRKWNKTHKDKELLKELKLYYLMEKTVLLKKPRKQEKNMLWEHFCLCDPTEENCKNKKYKF